MRGGAEQYHMAFLDTIQQHMGFEQATEAKQAPTPKSDKNKDKGGRNGNRFQCGGGRFNRGGRGRGRPYQTSNNNPSHPYNNNNYKSHFQDGGRSGGRFQQGGGQKEIGQGRGCGY